MKLGRVYGERQKYEILEDTNLGFERGSIFSNLYSKYGKELPLGMPTTDLQKKLMEVQKYNFYVIDTGMFLDNNPNDMAAMSCFIKFNRMLDRAVTSYESTYGPLCIDSIRNEKTPYMWVEGPWPWEGNK